MWPEPPRGTNPKRSRSRSARSAKPILESRRAKARMITGSKTLIVQRNTIVKRLRIGDYRPLVPGCLQELPHEVILPNRFGTRQIERAIDWLRERHVGHHGSPGDHGPARCVALGLLRAAIAGVGQRAVSGPRRERRPASPVCRRGKNPRAQRAAAGGLAGCGNLGLRFSRRREWAVCRYPQRAGVHLDL